MQRFQIGISFHYRGADNFFCKLVCFSRIGKLKQADHFCYGAVNRDLFFSSADRKAGKWRRMTHLPTTVYIFRISDTSFKGLFQIVTIFLQAVVFVEGECALIVCGYAELHERAVLF